MKIKELIAELQKDNPEANVYVYNVDDNGDWQRTTKIGIVRDVNTGTVELMESA